MPSKGGGSASDALKRTLTEIEERGKCIRIGLTIANDLALLSGFGLCVVVGFLGIYGKVCEDNTGKGCHIEALNKTGVNFKHGVEHLTHGVWIVATLQTLIAFYLGPLMVVHPLNLVCCGHHRRQVLAVYTVCFVILFLGHIGILIYGLFSRLASAMPDQTLFTDEVLPWYTLATALITLILLACVFLSEWFRRKHIVPKQDLSSIMQYKIHGPNNHRPMWEIEAAEVEFGEKIGEGHFGQCFKAEWREQQVVIKKLKQGVRGKGAEAEFENFKRELEVCIQMRHPRICQFLGASTDYNNMFICLEFLSGGSLLDLLHKKKEGMRRKMNLAQKMQIQTDVASGLAYLHQCKPPIAHRDLSSGNVLLDEHLRAKVADFGLSRKINTRMSKLPGNRFYMAPEVLTGTSEYSIEMDIYSFAIVSWEMYKRKRPFQGYKAYQLMEEVCRNQLRPAMPMDTNVCPRGLQKLIRKCWHQEPSERPSAKEVINVIEFERQLMANRRKSPHRHGMGSEYASHGHGKPPTAAQYPEQSRRPTSSRTGRTYVQVQDKYSQAAAHASRRGSHPDASRRGSHPGHPSHQSHASSASMQHRSAIVPHHRNTASEMDPAQLSEGAFINYNVNKAEKEMQRVLQTEKGQQVLEGTMRDSGMDRETTEQRLVAKMRAKAQEAARREYAARYEQIF